MAQLKIHFHFVILALFVSNFCLFIFSSQAIANSYSIKIKELSENPHSYINKVVTLQGEIIFVTKGKSLERVVSTVLKIDDGTGQIDAAFKGDIQSIEGSTITIKGYYKFDMPWWGPHSAAISFIDIIEAE